MHVLVLGAGAVGSYFGGRLAERDHAVTFVGRQSHIEAIRRQGLLIDSVATGKTRIRVQAFESLDPVPQADLILMTVKSYDTEAAARLLQSWIRGTSAVVLSLQNGVDNHETASRILGAVRVYPAVIYVAARLAEPGVVIHLGRGEVTLPEEVGGFRSSFMDAGIPAKVTDNIAGMLWANCC